MVVVGGMLLVCATVVLMENEGALHRGRYYAVEVSMQWCCLVPALVQSAFTFHLYCSQQSLSHACSRLYTLSSVALCGCCHRFPPPTKAAILVTLGQLIRRAGTGLKPFVPQLQTTFVKCLNDQVGVTELKQAGVQGREEIQAIPSRYWQGSIWINF